MPHTESDYEQTAREIAEDFKKTDKEIGENNELFMDTTRKGVWLICGSGQIIIGVIMIYMFFSFVDLLELIVYGIIIFIAGCVTLWAREFCFPFL